MIHPLLRCASSYARVQQTPITCYKLVSNVLAKTTPLAYQELRTSHKFILQHLPPKHRSPDVIPYHYTLLPNSLKRWGRLHIADAQSGDLLVSVDKDYDPDPSSRTPDAPHGTHIGIVSTIFHKNKDEINLSILDASRRTRGRLLCPPEEPITPSTPGRIAYSFLKILRNPATGLWTFTYKDQKPQPDKHLHVFRVEEPSVLILFISVLG